MAFARDPYTASASQTDFTITFPYLDEEDVLVYKDGALQTVVTDYTLPNATTVRFVTPLAGGEKVVIQRTSSQTERLVDYTAGALSEADLDNDSFQAFYMAQEAIDIAALSLGTGVDNLWDAASIIINNMATPTAAAHAATKGYVDSIMAAAGNVPTPTNPGEDDYLLKASGGTWTWAAATAFFWTLADDASAAAARTTLDAQIHSAKLTAVTGDRVATAARLALNELG